MRLSLRLRKLLMSLATCACFAAAVGIIAWGLNAPDIAHLPIDVSGLEVETAVEEVERGPTKEDFAELCGRPLRRALYDPPPPAPEVKLLPPIQIELLGTIIEAQNSIAMVKSAQGNTEYKRVGDAIGPQESPAQLVEIRGDSIILERAGDRLTFQVRGREMH